MMRWSRGSVTAGTKFTAHVQTPQAASEAAPFESKISLVKVRGQLEARIMMMPLARIHDGLTAMFTNATNLKVYKLESGGVY
jgi:hypothetical protein